MFYFAWVDPPSTAGVPTFLPEYARSDEVIFAFQLAHNEGEFPVLTIEIENPRAGLLAASRGRWAYFSWDGGAGGLEPLFYGRVVGAPEGSGMETVGLTLIARPPDFAAQKEAVADGLRVLPFYDPVWISAELRDDPDVVLQARSALWHIDRLSLEVSASDFTVGEVGPVEVSHLRDGFDIRFVKTPGRQVRIKCEVSWPQTAVGSVDVTQSIAAAFRAAGAPRSGYISTYTGQGLLRTWPLGGVEIGGGWKVGAVDLRRSPSSSCVVEKL